MSTKVQLMVLSCFITTRAMNLIPSACAFKSPLNPTQLTPRPSWRPSYRAPPGVSDTYVKTTWTKPPKGLFLFTIFFFRFCLCIRVLLLLCKPLGMYRTPSNVRKNLLISTHVHTFVFCVEKSNTRPLVGRDNIVDELGKTRAILVDRSHKTYMEGEYQHCRLRYSWHACGRRP